MRPLPVSCFVVSFSYWTCSLVSGLPIWARSVSDTAPLRKRRESSGLYIYNFVVVWVVWSNFCFLVWLFAITVMSCLWRYLFVGIALMTWPKTWPVGIDHCSVCYWFHGNLSKYASLPRYKSACREMRACNKCWSQNIESDLYTCLRRKTYIMRTRELHYCKELGTCVDCLCMLIPTYAVSSRD